MTQLRGAVVAGFATIALCFAAPAAMAATMQGFIVSNTTLKAGPDEQFPDVDNVGAGAEVMVNGCLSGYTWCDVSFQQDRGWISGQDLELLYQNRRVKVVEITTLDVVPVETFQVGVYWDEHYRDRPFYRDRDRFASININIDNGGKAKPGASGSGGQAEMNGKENKGKVVGEANGKAGDRTDNRDKTAGAAGQAASKEGNNCPDNQKNCKMQGAADQGKAMDHGNKAADQGNKGMDQGKAAMDQGKGAAGKTAKEGGGMMPADKSAENGKGGAPAANCKPGMADCGKAGAGKNGT
jgi:uncharacterized protein YraI